MKTRLALFALGLVVAVVPPARAQDSTKTRTLSSLLPFRGLHVDLGGGPVPYLDPREQGAAEMKISLPLRKYPNWSIALTTSTVIDTDTTSYVVPSSVTAGSSGFHPELVSTAVAFEVQKRWDQVGMFHPMGTIAVGSLMNTYSYYEYRSGAETLHEDGKTYMTYGHVAGGAELNITRWMRANVMLGFRSGGRMKIEGAKGSNGGLTMMINVLLGKF